MNTLILMSATLLGLVPPVTSAPVSVDASVAFAEPACLTRSSSVKDRLKCYRATLEAHPHHWRDDRPQPVIDWHADKARVIYDESAAFVAAMEGIYSRTQISQYMYVASLVILTDVYAEFYDTDARVRTICAAADDALKLAWQKTYCASDEDEPAVAAVAGNAQADAEQRYEQACGRPAPKFGAAPTSCKGVGDGRKAVSALAKVLLDKQGDALTLASLASPELRTPLSEALSTWQADLVTLSTTLEQEVSAGTFDPERHAKRIDDYRAKAELPRFVAIEAAKADAVANLYDELELEVPTDVSRIRALADEAPDPRKLCGSGAGSCELFQGALRSFYGKLERQDRKATKRWKDVLLSDEALEVFEQKGVRVSPQ